jgi:two-component system osmolarity sensor histidine kinase EnvZ
VSYSIEDDTYWVRIPRERLERRIAVRWFAWGVLALALALVAAYFIVSRVSRPLRTLATAAGELGRGRMPAPVPESGPQEIQTLAHAFNQMTRDLSRLEQDRALILAGVSHDLRTPLARLRLGLELGSQDEELRAGMHGDIEEMDRIIGQFLDFARLDGGEADQPLDLAALVGEAAERYRKLGRDLAVSTEPVEVSGKPLMLRRALANLVDTALRYGGPEPMVEVSLRRAGHGAVLEVMDRGPGIPESEMERLKQPFTRLEQARSGSGGSGLGLAIVDRVMQAHRGRFELASRAGGGLVARLVFGQAGRGG